jgi:hypothetical protein
MAEEEMQKASQVVLCTRCQKQARDAENGIGYVERGIQTQQEERPPVKKPAPEPAPEPAPVKVNQAELQSRRTALRQLQAQLAAARGDVRETQLLRAEAERLLLAEEEDTRLSDDGKAYTYNQFMELFGSADGARRWKAAEGKSPGNSPSKSPKSGKSGKRSKENAHANTMRELDERLKAGSDQLRSLESKLANFDLNGLDPGPTLTDGWAATDPWEQPAPKKAAVAVVEEAVQVDSSELPPSRSASENAGSKSSSSTGTEEDDEVDPFDEDELARTFQRRRNAICMERGEQPSLHAGPMPAEQRAQLAAAAFGPAV